MVLTTVNKDGIKDDSIVNADINSAAAIAGSKIAPDFGSQNIVTTGDLTVDTNTLKVDSTNNRVGINEASPDKALEIVSAQNSDGIDIVKGSNSSVFLGHNGSGDEGLLQLKDGGTTKIQIYGETGQASYFNAGNVGIGTDSPLRALHIAAAGDVALMLQTTNATNDKEIWEIGCGANASSEAELTFRTRVNDGTGGSEAMRIDSNGKVGIGGADPIVALDVNGEIALPHNNTIRWHDSGSTRCDMYGDSSNNFIIRNNSGNAISTLSNTGNLTITGDLVLASTKGINFSASPDIATGETTTSQILNDYEEGTFSPSISSTSRSGTITYHNDVGFYTKIGNRVFAQVYMQISGGTNQSNVFIVDGLPFTNISTASYEGGGYHTYMGGLFSAEADRQNTPWVTVDTNYVKFYKISDGNHLLGTATSTSTNYLIFHVQYIVA